MSLPAVHTDEDPEDPDPSGLIGRVLDGRYEVTGLLGVGGIGRVYRADYLPLKREVALKVLLEHYQCVPELQRRFEREAMALAALSHPNIVTITDFVSNRDTTFLVMELVEGHDLDYLLESNSEHLPRHAFDIMEQILSSLAYAHEKEVIHRDLKPQNVLVTELAAGRLHAKILDFGLAKFMDGSGPSANLTKTGLIVGTPAYMAPEQASGGNTDKRADVYAAGIMFFEMLAGVHPFDGFDGAELLRQHLLVPAPTLASFCEGAHIAPELEALLARALAKDGAQRYADGDAMLHALLGLPPDAFVPKGAGAPKARTRSTAPTAIAPPRAAVSEAPPKPKARRSDLPVLIVAALAIVTVAAMLIFVYVHTQANPEMFTPPAAHPEGVDSVPDPPEVIAEETPVEETVPAIAVETPVVVADASVAAIVDEPVLTEEPTLGESPIVALPTPETRPPAGNPWRGDTPAPLARVRRRLQGNEEITPVHVRQVTSYRRQHPEDPRGRLLLGAVYTERGQFVAALDQYQALYRADPSARGDDRMRTDLVRMAGSAMNEQATAALVEIYGREAIATVRRSLRRAQGDSQTRLQATLTALEALPE